MKKLVVVVAITVFILALQTELLGQEASHRALPDDNLAYPALITLKNSNTGSGFYVNTGSAMYLVTAKHVLLNPQTNALIDNSFEVWSYSKDLSDPTPNVVAVDMSTVPRDNLRVHPSQDVVAIKMFSRRDAQNGAHMVAALPGITVRQAAKAGFLGTDLDGFTTFEHVLVGNDVLILGYPTSIGLQQMPQIDAHRPLLRKGIVAGTNIQRRSIVLDCPSYPGNSGGPVIEIDKVGFSEHFQIIGVVSEYVPYADQGKNFFMVANSGYSIATPIDFVLELLK